MVFPSGICTSIANACELTQQKADQVVTAFVQAITATLEQGDGVALLGFGGFAVKSRPERKGRNPSTGKEITLPASKNVSFKPGSKLKAAINRKSE